MIYKFYIDDDSHDEFEEKAGQRIYVSATPGPYELEHQQIMLEL